MAKNILLTGTTGMIGNIILQKCLNNPNIAKVTSISRKSTGSKHPKLVEVLHQDFTDFSSISQHFQNQDVAHYCLGVYTGQVNRELFRKITVDFTKAFGETLKQYSPMATFCFLSGAGADSTEKSRVAFAKDKGIAENILIKLKFKQVYIFRPAYIYPVTPRQEPSFGYRILRSLYPLFKKLYPSGVITSEQLGEAMFKAGLVGAEKAILENENIKQIL